jgi:hypothetical protein
MEIAQPQDDPDLTADREALIMIGYQVLLSSPCDNCT